MIWTQWPNAPADQLSACCSNVPPYAYRIGGTPWPASKIVRTDSSTSAYLLKKKPQKADLNIYRSFYDKRSNKAHNYNRQVIYALIVQYRNRIASVKALNTHKSTQYEQELGRLRAIAFAAERAAIHDLTEKGYITMTMAQKLNQNVNFTENAATLTSLEEV